MNGKVVTVLWPRPGRITAVKSFASRASRWVLEIGASNSPLIAWIGKSSVARSSGGAVEGAARAAVLHALQLRQVVAVGAFAKRALAVLLLGVVALGIALGGCFLQRLVLLADARTAETGGDEAARVARQQVRDDAAAHRIAVEVRLADAEVVQNLDHVGRHLVAGVLGRIVRFLAAATWPRASIPITRWSRASSLATPLANHPASCSELM